MTNFKWVIVYWSSHSHVASSVFQMITCEKQSTPSASEWAKRRLAMLSEFVWYFNSVSWGCCLCLLLLIQPLPCLLALCMLLFPLTVSFHVWLSLSQCWPSSGDRHLFPPRTESVLTPTVVYCWFPLCSWEQSVRYPGDLISCFLKTVAPLLQ